MCAIAGVLGLPTDKKTLDHMLTTMARRGPDARNHALVKDGALLHSRLAVIDPSGGAQPMSVTTGKETYTIVYNGELYNTDELRRELTALGHSFRGHSDTEVMLHGYIQWGEDCLTRCNGIFAFGVYEENAGRLFLARDRMGVKPLFYKLHDRGLIFASEIKTILAYPTVKAKLDLEGAAEILLLGPGRTPGSGVFHGISALEPGCCAYYRSGRMELKQYWRLKDREHRESFEETAETIRYLVKDSIRRQMVSDVPLGTFLSGGLDSSLITAICAEAFAERGKQLPTFSVDYQDNANFFVPDKFQPNSDVEFIHIMRETLYTNHHYTVLTPEQLAESMGEAVAARDLPGMADVDISLLLFCREIRKYVTVALSGECADEIFGGYPWFRDPEIRDKEGFPWAQNTGHRCDMMAPALQQRIDGEAYVRERYEMTCRESDILPGTSPTERRMKEMINLNQRWFMQTLLDRKDRMSMYSGLEVRVPFCDHRIAEYMYGVPWEFKDYRGKEKGLLRYAMEGVLPNEVLWRKKSPYPKIWNPKYMELVSQRLNELLQQKDAPLFYLVSRDEAAKLLRQQSVWPWYGQLMRTPQTICFLLQINEWLQRYNIEFMW